MASLNLNDCPRMRNGPVSSGSLTKHFKSNHTYLWSFLQSVALSCGAHKDKQDILTIIKRGYFTNHTRQMHDKLNNNTRFK